MAWDVIASVTLASDAASISFASIDSKYKIFRVTAYIVNDASAKNIQFRFNNDSGANYDRQQLLGNSTTVTAGRSTGQTSLLIGSPGDANAVATFEAVIAKQTAANDAMMLLSETYTATALRKGAWANRWSNNSALINRIDLLASTGNFAAGTVVVLEGIPD